jgi:2-polyprenyl-3-methyl-5-hydroxy-6-metoxy-1,4-benzoquinol methylase
MSQKNHWEQVYATRSADKLGWYERHLQTSLRWIGEQNLAADAPIIDVGGGASTLVDDLLDRGYRSLTVLDLSEQALSSTKARLGKSAEQVTWLAGDIAAIDLLEQYYEVWHDRALFHFFTESAQQRQYRDRLLKALKPGGHVIIATFAPEAPPTCSGLPVQRYSPKQLAAVLGGALELQRQHKELHITPGGVEQTYVYCHFRKKTGESP